MTSTTPTAIPAPDRTARDELGRLVAASWGTATDNDAGRSGRWLVAVDGSEGSLRAAAMAARLIAAQARAGIDLVHVHPWLVKEAAEVELARRGWHATAAVRALTGGHGVHTVYDGVGASTFDASLASLRPRGALALAFQISVFGGSTKADEPSVMLVTTVVSMVATRVMG